MQSAQIPATGEWLVQQATGRVYAYTERLAATDGMLFYSNGQQRINILQGTNRSKPPPSSGPNDLQSLLAENEQLRQNNAHMEEAMMAMQSQLGLIQSHLNMPNSPQLLPSVRAPVTPQVAQEPTAPQNVQDLMPPPMVDIDMVQPIQFGG